MPMPTRDGLILTGATGLLGRYLLRDLLLSGQSVVVLAHDSRAGTAADRIGAVVDFWCEALGRNLPRPIVLTADLTHPNLGLATSDRAWLARHCRGIVHSAAKVSMRRSADGEPERTNVAGTQRLLELCATLRSGEFHHVSTSLRLRNQLRPHPRARSGMRTGIPQRLRAEQVRGGAVGQHSRD